MAGRLQDRVALITGAGMGIGKGVARRFAREGARVVVAEKNPETGKSATAELEALGVEARFIETDVGVEADVEASVQCAVDAWGRLDILVNNAWAGAPLARVEWRTTEEMETALRVGFLSNFWSMKAAFPHMKRAGYGRIVNMCSLNGVNAHVFSVHYNTAKEAVRTLTRTAAVEWAPYGITCNVICPAAATESYVAFRTAQPEIAADMLKQNPVGRMGDPEEDIGNVALFLASDESAYVTGNTLHADGGGHINGVSWKPEMPEDLPG